MALGIVLSTCIIIPFCFWLGGWNFERNDAGVACVVITLFVSLAGGSITMGIGSDNKE